MTVTDKLALRLDDVYAVSIHIMYVLARVLVIFHLKESQVDFVISF